MFTDVWLVVPLYNEAQVVGDVIAAASLTFPKIVCVDDGSTDDSVRLAREAGAVVVHHPVNLGQGAALQTGFDYVMGDPDMRYAVTFDADGQHRVEDAVRMVQALRDEDVEVVLGSRFLGSTTRAGLAKRALLRLAVVFERMTTGLKVTDTHNGLRALTRTALEQIRIRQNRMAHGSEFLREIARSGLPFREEPVHIVYTDYTRSKGQSMWNMVNIMNDLIFD